MSDIKKQVQHIVNTLENPPLQCEECREEYTEETATDYCECGGPIHTMSGFDYLTDALDIEWTLSSDKQTLLGARVLVCFGGPNVWIDTRNNRVDGHWWGDSYNEAFTDNIGLNEAVEEIWECGNCDGFLIEVEKDDLDELVEV